MSTIGLPRRSSRQHLPSAKSADWSRTGMVMSECFSSTERELRTPAPAMHRSSSFTADKQVPVKCASSFTNRGEVAAFYAPPSTASVSQPAPAHNPPAPFAKQLPTPASVVAVTFDIRVETNWGDTALLVGSTRELGEWRPQDGVRMSTDASSYPVWTARTSLPANSHVEYKVVILRASSEVDWEPLEHNRSLAVRDSGEVSVQAAWSVASGDDRWTGTALPDVLATPTTAAYSGAPMMMHMPPQQTQAQCAPTQHRFRHPDSLGGVGAAPPAMPGTEQAAARRVHNHPTFASAPRPSASFSLPSSGGCATGPMQHHAFDPARAMQLLSNSCIPSAISHPPPAAPIAAAFDAAVERYAMTTNGGMNPPPPQAAPPLGTTPLEAPQSYTPVMPPRRVMSFNQPYHSPLEAIRSQDMSWPPSINSSIHGSIAGSQASLPSQASNTDADVEVA